MKIVIFIMHRIPKVRYCLILKGFSRGRVLYYFYNNSVQLNGYKVEDTSVVACMLHFGFFVVVIKVPWRLPAAFLVSVLCALLN